MRSIVIMTASMIALCAASAAYAEHGKVGHWDITVKNEYPGLPKLTPTQRRQYEMQGIAVPDTRTKHYKHCMTAEEVNSMSLPKMGGNKAQCTISNPHLNGAAFEAHVSCSGLFQGEGGLTVSYDKPEHYAGITRVQGTFAGQELEMVSRFEGTWTSPTCESGDDD